jgi:type IV secretion system pilin
MKHLLNFAQVDPSNLPNKGEVDAGTFVDIANIAISIFAAVAVLAMVVAGFRYIIAKGEPQALAQAKNMIIYAAVGLAICVMAFAIVNFVLDRLF